MENPLVDRLVADMLLMIAVVDTPGNLLGGISFLQACLDVPFEIRIILNLSIRPLDASSTNQVPMMRFGPMVGAISLTVSLKLSCYR